MRNPISRKGAKARRRRHLFLKDNQPEDPPAKALPAASRYCGTPSHAASKRPQYTGSETFVLGSSSIGKGAAGVAALFLRDLARATLAACAIFGTNLFAV
jgi:hypothetical protein